VRLPAPLQAHLVGLDAAATMLGAHPPPVVHATAAALPFVAEVFDAAVAINVLDHLPEPTVAIDQAHRVLAPGGAFLAATSSRHDPPELAPLWRRPHPPASTPQHAPRLVASVFGQAQVQRWDAPVRLPATRSATT
jgi:SAM-dependent methyltransferase